MTEWIDKFINFALGTHRFKFIKQTFLWQTFDTFNASRNIDLISRGGLLLIASKLLEWLQLIDLYNN